MVRPWVTPSEVKAYSSSVRVKEREDSQLVIDIALAEKNVIYFTNNKFDLVEYELGVPSDVRTAIVVLAESYASKSINRATGKSTETFDDYSYTLNNKFDTLESLGLEPLLSEYVVKKVSGTVTMKLRKL